MRLSALLLLGIALLILLPALAQDDSTDILRTPDRRINGVPSDTVAFSPDGEWVAVGSRDNFIRIYQVSTGALRGNLSGHSAWVTHLAFSPDGARLVSAGQDNTVRLWDVVALSSLQVFTHHTATVTGVDYADNGLMIASGSLDGTVWVADAATGTTLATLTNYSGPVWSVAFSADGRTLVSGSEDGTLWIWGLYDSSVTTLEGEGTAVTGLAFHPIDPTRLVAGNWDGSVKIWDLAAGALVAELTGHAGPVTGVAFNADGTEIISAGLDGTVRLWDALDGREKGILQAADTPLPLADVAYDAVNGQIISANLDGGLDLWARAGRVETYMVARPTSLPATASPIPPTRAPVVVQAPTSIPQPTIPENLVFPTPTHGIIVTQALAPTIPPAIAQAPTPNPGETSLSLPTVNIFSGLTSFPVVGPTWQIDPWEHAVGHFQGTAWIEHTGNIVLGGHSEYPDGSRGIFNGLYGVNVGDPIYLTVDGQQRRYIVTEKTTVDYRNLDPVRPSSDNRLTLITCDIPSYDVDASLYWERLVVVAVLS